MIKYRVFQKELGVYLRPEITRIDGNGKLFVNDVPVSIGTYIVEEWARGSDADNRDIYKGDILADIKYKDSLGSPCVYQVVECDGQFRGENEDYDYCGSQNSRYLNNYDFDECRVIGTRHDDKSLIETRAKELSSNE
jgi:hypothetical protein